MVIPARAVRLIACLQLIAALTVFVNHLPISLIRGRPDLFGSAVYNEPVTWGISFLFVSSGVLLHDLRHSLFPSANPVVSAMAFVSRRFWRLAVPVFVAVALDFFLLAHASLGTTPNAIHGALAMLTLSQTWFYQVLGQTSLGLPLTGSNMAWFGASLFFLSVTYAATHRLWPRLGPTGAAWLVAVTVLLFAGQHHVLDAYTPQIQAYQTGRYGADLAGPYTLWAWLFEYAPVSYLLPFLSGVGLAAWLRPSRGGPGPLGLLLIVSTALAVTVLPSAGPVRYVGVSILLLIAVGGAGQGGPDIPDAAEGNATSTFWRLGHVAYEIFILHLVLFTPFNLTTTPELNASTTALLLARITVASAVTVFLCYGLSQLVFQPLARRLSILSGAPPVEDRYV